MSTAKQEEEQTIKSQLNACYEYAKKNGYVIAREFKDEGWSGDTLARPALDQLRQEAKNRKWDAVLIYDPDRLARRYSYQELVIDELKEAELEVLFVTVSSPKNHEDKILHGVRGLFAEYERAKITERFRLGKVRKLKEGHILVGRPLYGYTYVPKQGEKHGYYVINEEEAEVVRMIFNLSKQGVSIKKIIRHLQEQGIKPKYSTRGLWSSSTISRMLRNETYTGKAHWGSTYGVLPKNPTNTNRYNRRKKSRRKPKPRKEWYFVPVPAIIGKALFNEIQQQLKANSELASRNTKNKYLLTGKTYCSCGCKRFGEVSKSCSSRLLYYRCSSRLTNLPFEQACKEKFIRADMLEQLVWEKLKELMSSPNLMMAQLKKWNEKKEKQLQAPENTTQPQEKLKKLNKEIKRYTKAYGEGILTIKQLKECVNPIKEKIAKIEADVLHAKEAETDKIVIPEVEDLTLFSNHVKQKLDNPGFEAKRAIVLLIVDKIIADQQEVVVRGKIALDKIMGMTNYSEMPPMEEKGDATDLAHHDFVSDKGRSMSPYTGLRSLYSHDRNSTPQISLLSSSHMHDGNLIRLPEANLCIDDKYGRDAMRHNHNEAIPFQIKCPLPRL